MRENRYSLWVEVYFTPQPINYVADLRLPYKENITKQQVINNFNAIARRLDGSIQWEHSSARLKWFMAEDLYGGKVKFTELELPKEPL